MNALAIAFGRDYRYPRLSLSRSTAFYGMPVGDVVPTSATLRPDLAPFVLNETVVMDGGFFERLTRSPTPAYTDIADFYSHAHRAGRLHLVDFDVVLEEERHRLDEMTSIDVEDVEPWIPRIIESLEIWDNLVNRSDKLKSMLASDQRRHLDVDGHAVLPIHPGHFGDTLAAVTGRNIRANLRYLHNVKFDALQNVDLYKALLFKSHRKTKLQRGVLKAYVESRLAYVNANIVLAQKYDAALYDWNDFAPFYRRKFAQLGQASPDGGSKTKLSKLFSLLFPSQTVSDYQSFFRALDDRRVAELRTLCRDAAAGSVEFDQAFAASVWREQLKWAQDQREFTRRMSWWTLPANAVPYVGSALAFGTQKAAEKIYARKNSEPHSWLFVFSDVFDPNKDTEG